MTEHRRNQLYRYPGAVQIHLKEDINPMSHCSNKASQPCAASFSWQVCYLIQNLTSHTFETSPLGMTIPADAIGRQGERRFALFDFLQR